MKNSFFLRGVSAYTSSVGTIFLSNPARLWIGDGLSDKLLQHMVFDINYMAVLVTGVIVMTLGAFWYSPAGFGKPWMRLMGFTKESMEANQAKGNAAMWKYYLSAMLANLVMVDVLAHFVDMAKISTVMDGVVLGFWAWLGFVAMPSLSAVIWEGRPWKLYFINVGYLLASLVLAGGILAVWK